MCCRPDASRGAPGFAECDQARQDRDRICWTGHRGDGSRPFLFHRIPAIVAFHCDSARRQAGLHDAALPDRNPRCRCDRRRPEGCVRSTLRCHVSALSSSTTEDTKVHEGESLAVPSCTFVSFVDNAFEIPPHPVRLRSPGLLWSNAVTTKLSLEKYETYPASSALALGCVVPRNIVGRRALARCIHSDRLRLSPGRSALSRPAPQSRAFLSRGEDCGQDRRPASQARVRRHHRIWRYRCGRSFQEWLGPCGHVARRTRCLARPGENGSPLC